MKAQTHGIHHITAIASNPRDTLHFYSHILGLRLVKKTVNQDDVKTYHLFFGDRTGKPGMDLTFFTFQPAFSGQRGNGLVTTISLAVPEKSLDFWQQRFSAFKVKHESLTTKWGYPCLTFYDGDHQRFELVGIKEKELGPDAQVWSTKEVSTECAIRSFDSATLNTASLRLIEPILTHALGYKVLEKQGSVTLYHQPTAERAAYLEVFEDRDAEAGLSGAGTVHHIAFRVKDEAEQNKVRDAVSELGLYPTETIDRYYFKSVYFRSPAGILFEIATDSPGFTADENEASLGEKLALPPFLEAQRNEIEAGLPPL